MKIQLKPYRNYTAYYALLMEPELKMRLAELKTFHEIDVPECIRELIRAWVLEIESKLREG